MVTGQDVRIIVPFPWPGDILRLLADQIGDRPNENCHQQRPGGAASWHRGRGADRTTLLVANSFLINASLKTDRLRSNFPASSVCLLAHTPFVLVVNATSGHTSAQPAHRRGMAAKLILDRRDRSDTPARRHRSDQATPARLSFVPYSGGRRSSATARQPYQRGAGQLLGCEGHLGSKLRAVGLSRERSAICRMFDACRGGRRRHRCRGLDGRGGAGQNARAGRRPDHVHLRSALAAPESGPLKSLELHRLDHAARSSALAPTRRIARFAGREHEGRLVKPTVAAAQCRAGSTDISFGNTIESCASAIPPHGAAA